MGHDPRVFLLLACAAPDEDRAPLPQDSGRTDALEVVPDAPAPSDAVFDPLFVHRLDLTMSPHDWAVLRDNPWGADWVAADFALDGETLETIGVRPFGYGSRTAGKPPLKLSFDHLVAGQTFRELEQLKLDNSVQDGTFLHEQLGTTVLRRFGVPAHRVGNARVYVNGADAGLYVLLESVDDRYLQRWFGNDDGILYGTIQGAWGHGLTPFERSPLDYYNVQTVVPSDGEDLLGVADVIAHGTDEELDAALDGENFLRQTLARSTFGSWDSFSADGNNFYLYNDGGRFSILPWDLDYEFETPGVWNALQVDPRHPERTSPWSVDSLTGVPYVDPVLARQIASGADIDALLVELATGAMEWNRLDAEVVAAAATLGPYVANDPSGLAPGWPYRVADLRLLLHARLARTLGREVAACEATPAGVLGPGDLAASASVGWGAFETDGIPEYWGPGFNVGGEHHCTGWFAHAPSTITVEIPAGCHTLRAGAGIQIWNQVCGDGAELSVVQAGATIWSSGAVAVYAPAVPTGELPISPGTLELRASPLGEYSCDTTVWVDVEVDCR
jgi:hypothetical protein